MSPMLFILASEPWAVAIRSSLIMKSTESEHRVTLYADDTILLLTSLERFIPAFLKLTERFRKFSGYKINNTKSSILFLNIQESTTFINTVNGFKHLGVVITSTIDKWISANYNPVITKVSASLDRWSSPPVSLIGRINIITFIHLHLLLSKSVCYFIKLNIIPKFLYLFRPITLPPPSGSFPNMNTTLTRFICKTDEQDFA